MYLDCISSYDIDFFCVFVKGVYNDLRINDSQLNEYLGKKQFAGDDSVLSMLSGKIERGYRIRGTPSLVGFINKEFNVLWIVKANKKTEQILKKLDNKYELFKNVNFFLQLDKAKSKANL